MNDSIPYVYETFKYDTNNRLVEHTQLPTDTFIYSYLGNDTMKYSERWIHWVSTLDSAKWVQVPRTTTYTYDNSGKLISSTWIDDEDRMSVRRDFYYDNKNRIRMMRDTSLDNYNREPNSCCILYRTEYKYDHFNRLIEELYTTGSADHPKPQLNRKLTYQY